MRFEVVFVVEDKYRTFGDCVVRVAPQVGMWHIERIEEYVKAPIPLDEVCFPTKEIAFQSIGIAPRLGYVRECCHFASSKTVTVEVLPNGLCGFLFLRAVVYYKRGAGIADEPSRVGFDYMLDEDRIIEEWRRAGYPLQWSIRTTFDPYRMVVRLETISAACEDTEIGATGAAVDNKSILVRIV